MSIPSSVTLPLTKRCITAIISGIYDVFGFGAPAIVKRKIGLQELWRENLDWDQPIPEKMQDKWLRWIEEIRKLGTRKFDRCLTPANASDSYLVIVCDASNVAFGSVAY
ncbi:uncharacterized protein LOC141909144 [Tubulanus polymorphus]|uniref:uncharacterized protein LOC141909144 n=1 Tax=Tubulanus polymorphus TaxID=672921 RepID=UPI003DA2ADFB